MTERLGAANRTLVTNHVRRFALVGGALVVDLREAGGVDDSVAVPGSWGEAMRRITTRLTARRSLVELSV